MELDEYRLIAQAETSHWWYAATRSLLRSLVAPMLADGGVFLDAGCGPGATGGWMAERGTVIGADIEPLALSLYREGRASVALGAADVMALPFPDATFDAVLCVTVLYHDAIASPERAVGELARVTKPGGVVAVMEPGVRRLRRAHDRVTHGARRFSRRDLATLLTANGLTVERSTGAYTFLVPPAVLKALIERGRVASDVARNDTGLFGLLPRAASLERRLIERVDLPFGLSVVAIGRKP